MPLARKLSLRKIFCAIPFFASFLMLFYFSGIVVFGLFRLLLLLYAADGTIHLFDSITLKAFGIGFRFDSVILAYVLFTPLLFLFIQFLAGFRGKIIKYFVTLYLCVLFPLLIFISIVDIPYFAFFNNRLTEASLQWLSDFGIVFRMVLANAVNCIFLVFALILMIGAGILIFKFCRRKLINRSNDKEYRRHGPVIYIFTFLLLSFVTFIGMRGKITHPIRQGDAFYCNNPLLNQIGLNPAFTLMKSYVTKVRLMDDVTALDNTRQILKIENPLIEISPVARKIVGNDSVRKFNIILVLMESMSADYMGIFGNTRNLTPVLDSLSKNSWFFKNAYSAGIHTNNGVFSTLYSLPALRRIRPMSTVPVRTYTGLPYTLRQLGYKNLFFGTHSESFDNLGVFIPANYFDELYTAEDYPGDKVVGPFGVPDDFLYSYTIERLNKIDSTQPFFATVLTCSNHDPYILPAYYKSEIKEKDLMGVNYADWAIGKFLSEAKTTNWFKNTMFVFVSDHGLKVGKSAYDVILSYHHIPLLFYAPGIIKEPKVYDNYIGQIDVFPTLMGLMNVSYINNTLGTDVLKQKRACIYFSADDKIGCIDEEWLYIYRFGGTEGLYKYKNSDPTDYSSVNKIDFERLRKHALSQTQVSDWLISHDKTSIKTNKRIINFQ